jgi:hypothetical protein
MPFALFQLSPPELLILGLGALIIWPFWRIFARAGLPGWLALGMILPLLNIVLLFVLAYARWPALERRDDDDGYRPRLDERALEEAARRLPARPDAGGRGASEAVVAVCTNCGAPLQPGASADGRCAACRAKTPR